MSAVSSYRLEIPSQEGFFLFVQDLLRHIKVIKKVKIRNRYNHVPHLTQDTTWESDMNTLKHHIQQSQVISPFLAGDHKAAMNRPEGMTNMKHK